MGTYKKRCRSGIQPETLFQESSSRRQGWRQDHSRRSKKPTQESGLVPNTPIASLKQGLSAQFMCISQTHGGGVEIPGEAGHGS